tara:strand:- start:22 stop:291 length:270 start_codon:yes stop_codon:yes gene_type:complete
MKHYKDSSNNIYAYESDGSQDHLIPDNYIAITDEEADAIRLYVKTYADLREEEYPSIGDQLDMIYKDMKNNTTTHADAVEAVKTKYPKS